MRQVACIACTVAAFVLFAAMVYASVIRVPGMSGIRPQSRATGAAAYGSDLSGNGIAGATVDGGRADESSDGRNANVLRKSAVPTYDPAKPFTATQRRNILAVAQRTAEASGKPQHQYRYCVAAKGDVGDITMFSQTVYMTLNNPRGWPRAGLTFVQSGNGERCDMTYTLSQAQYMRTFSPICSPKYSCRAGDSVIVNYDRWRHPTESWLNGGGTLAEYRTMVINHETGHKLDHRDNESVCPAPGKPAPLMQEQSMSLRGCTINPWPLESELWAHW